MPPPWKVAAPAPKVALDWLTGLEPQRFQSPADGCIERIGHLLESILQPVERRPPLPLGFAVLDLGSKPVIHIAHAVMACA